MKVENVDVLVFVKEALDVSGAQVSLVHHLSSPPGVLGRGEYCLRLSTGTPSPREELVRSELFTLKLSQDPSRYCALIGGTYCQYAIKTHLKAKRHLQGAFCDFQYVVMA